MDSPREVIITTSADFSPIRDKLFARLRDDIEKGLASGDVEVSGDKLHYKAGFLGVRSSFNTSRFYGLKEASFEVSPVPEGIRIRYALDYGHYSWVIYGIAVALSVGMAVFTRMALFLFFPLLVGIVDLIERQRGRNVIGGLPEYLKKAVSDSCE